MSLFGREERRRIAELEAEVRRLTHAEARTRIIGYTVDYRGPHLGYTSHVTFAEALKWAKDHGYDPDSPDPEKQRSGISVEYADTFREADEERHGNGTHFNEDWRLVYNSGWGSLSREEKDQAAWEKAYESATPEQRAKVDEFARQASEAFKQSYEASKQSQAEQIDSA